MAVNQGAAPPSPATEVGQLRINLGDINYTEIEGEPDQGSYEWFADSELEELLEVSNDSITRATGYGFRKLAGILALSATDVASDDLRIKTIERAKLMRDLAKDWLDSADAEDAAAAADIFEIVPFGGIKSPRPEGTPWPLSTGFDTVPTEWSVDPDGYIV